MMNHTRSLAVAALATVTMGLTAPAHADAVVPCPTEDSLGPCHWDAQHQGNHEGRSFTAYRHHRMVTGRVALTLHQVHNVEHIVHRLPECLPDQPEGCRVFLGHRHTVAVFAADRRTYFARMNHGHLSHVEVYPR